MIEKSLKNTEMAFLTPISPEPEAISTSGHLHQMVLDKVSDYMEYHFRSYSSFPCSRGKKVWSLIDPYQLTEFGCSGPSHGDIHC